MLSSIEFKQLFTAIVPMIGNRINGRDQVDALHVLHLIAAFCDEQVKIEQVERDGGRVMCAQITPNARAPAVLNGEKSNGQQ